MIGYVTLGTNDREKSSKFYDALCGELGVGRMMENEQFIAWGKPGGGAGIGVTRPFDGNAASVGNGVMVAIEAKDEAQVQRLYDIALANGGTDEGAPGDRGGGFYAGYFRDPDGNKLNAFVMGGRMMRQARSLFDYPIHLGRGARAVAEPSSPAPNGMRPMASATPTTSTKAGSSPCSGSRRPWTSWEMHPAGEEVVCCRPGPHDSPPGAARTAPRQSHELGPGDYAINPRGAWHTADADEPVVALFITAGKGTENRPR